uniref:hypothetical protein n=1 Tax=Fulvivirga sp. TaxID=1931237 RepID=UPI00404AFD31
YMIIFAAYLALLLYVQLWFGFSFLYVYAIFMSSLVVFMIAMLIGKNNPIKNWIGSSMASSISAIYQSNIGKWSTLAYSFLIIGLSMPGIRNDIGNFTKYLNNSSVDDEELEWSPKEEYYTDKRDPQMRFARTNIPSEVVSNDYLSLAVSYYKEDETNITSYNETYAKTIDTLNWKQINAPSDLYRVYINDSLFNTDKWVATMFEESDQKAYSTLIDISNLPEGYHTVRVEKLLEFQFPFAYKYTPDIRLRKNWSKFNFIKVKD